jgi:hypothetical protein
VPYYRSYLKNAVLQGTTVINNPFMWTADDKFFEASLATRLGVAHPKTIAMPNKDYVPGIVHDESLRNLHYPLDWDELLDYVGLPCVLKDAHGGGWKDVFICHTKEDLWHAYNQSGCTDDLAGVSAGTLRALHVPGPEEVLPMRYDPHAALHRRSRPHDPNGRAGRGDALEAVRALGYDMNTELPCAAACPTPSTS